MTARLKRSCWQAALLFVRTETVQAKGERIIAEELQRFHCEESELVERKKRDPEKLALAIRLRKETGLTIKVITARLHLGTTRNAAGRLRELRTEHVLTPTLDARAAPAPSA